MLESIVSYLLLLALLSRLVASIAPEHASGSNEELQREEMHALRNLKPLIDYPKIMFWRPQKVGSSTILSLLLSFGYRNNILPRRKSSGTSFLCRKIAKCGLERIEGLNEVEMIEHMSQLSTPISQIDSIHEYLSKLRDFIKYGKSILSTSNKRVIYLTRTTLTSYIYILLLGGII